VWSFIEIIGIFCAEVLLLKIVQVFWRWLQGNELPLPEEKKVLVTRSLTSHSNHTPPQNTAMPLPTNNLRPSPAPYSSGRGLFLTQRVDAGQLVLHIPNPLVAVPDDKHLGSCCSWCLKWDAPVEKEREAREKEKEKEEEYPDPGIEIEGEDVGKVELVRCSGCKVVWYCGKVG